MVNKIRRRILMAGALSPVASYVFGAVNPITNENALTGDAAWRVSNYPTFFDWGTQTFSSGVPYPEIEGYASASSVNIGETIGFHVNCAQATFTLKVYRLGWYGGRGSRLMTQIPLTGVKQQIPTPSSLGAIDCNWAQTYALAIPISWTSGMYYAKLVAASGVESAITFVVRDDARDADFIFQSAFNTAQAYNNWGGKSLYEFNSKGSQRATAVSFNRPDSDEGGAGQVTKWELSMIRFLEREGYDVKYIANMDVHNNPSVLLRGKGFLSVGHDEYWSYEMKSAVQTAVDAGKHMAFLGANTCYWQVRISGRTMLAYKENYASDPFMNTDKKRVTGRWRDLPAIGVTDPIARPENNLLGVQYHGDPVNSDLIVFDPTHWIFAGTNVVKGTRFAGLLGYETDAIFANGFSPANLQKVMESPDAFGSSHCTSYTHTSGALVFAAGTMQWSWGVDFVPSWAPNSGTNRTNATFQQINRNLLSRMSGGILSAPTNVRVTGNVIQWDPVSGAATYDLYRSGTSNAPLGTPYKSGLTTPSFVENTPLGTTAYYKIVARNGAASSAPSAEVSIVGTLTKTAQTITFQPLAAKKVGDPAFQISATASSGLPVTFSSLTPSVVTVSGTTVTIVAAGTAIIAANQAGNATYEPAPQVTQSFAVTAATTGNPPLAPSKLTGYSCNTGCWAYASQGGAALRINWTQSTSPGITTNTVYRGNGTTGALTAIATISAATTYIDKSAVVGQTYHYRVTATNLGGTSPMSNDTAVAMMV